MKIITKQGRQRDTLGGVKPGTVFTFGRGGAGTVYMKLNESGFVQLSNGKVCPIINGATPVEVAVNATLTVEF